MSDQSAGYSGANPLEPEAFPELASVLRSQTDAIIQRWDEVARQAQQVVGNLDLEQMKDQMPEILSMLADLLEDPNRQHMQTLVDRAPEHGAVRFEQQYDVPQLMAEGRLLRRVVVEKAEEALKRQMNREESLGLHTGIDILLQGGILAMVKKQQEAQRESEQRYRLSIEQVRDYAIFMIDPQGRMASWNAGVRQVLGWEESEFLGEPFSILFPPENIPTGPAAELQKARDLGYAENDRWQVKRDGSRFWASGITSAVRDEHGRVTGFLKVMRDLTDRKRIEDQLALAREEAEAASRAKDEFLAVLSHELRTPLTPTLLSVSLLERRHDLPAEAREDIETIRRSVELEARLIDDLLDLTKITRGKLQLHPETIDAHLLVRRAFELCCRDHPQQAHLELNAELHHVHADPARMQQVLWNLLNNAVKFTPASGSIRIRTSNVDEHIRIEVTDTGIGIDPEVLPRIFDAFEQGQSSTTRQFGGLGLGLAISSRLMKMQGGSLTAHSEGSGKGASFFVEMPAVPAPAPRATAVRTEEQQELPPRRLRILVVEDNEATLRVLSRLLMSLGQDARMANTVASALKAAEQEEFDLILSDLGLPDGTGYELMRTLRERTGVAGVALSGYGTEDDVRRSLEAGFVEHLTKPVDLNALEAVIGRVVTRSPRP